MNRKWMSFFCFLAVLPVASKAASAPRSDADVPPVQTLRSLARPLRSPKDLEPLIERAAASKLVLLGEASHGTSEFYTWRTEISKRLIREKGFRFIAVEGDWASCYRLNRYVKDLPGAEPDAREIMRSFSRWPVWMWANEETLELIEWLREFNLSRPPEDRVGFYGIDVYGGDQALSSMLDKLRTLDSDLAEEAAALYEPFLPYAGDARGYVQLLRTGGPAFARGAANGYALLEERTQSLLEENPAARLNILKSARVVQNAELHYRSMLGARHSSWNVRADHFFSTVERLMNFYGPDAQGVVWAHNTHIGDARATSMSVSGERNIGQTARQSLGRDRVTAVGFGTYQGTVAAGRRWGEEREIMTLPPGGRDSVEAMMNSLRMDRILFLFDRGETFPGLEIPYGHRAVGTVYNPEYEYPGNYVPTLLTERYDAFIFIRETAALRPID